MNTPLLRLLVAGGGLAVACLLSGCASVVQNLDQFAFTLEQQTRQQAYESYLREYYRPRATGDASAPGIK
jgi:hypothetical protein